MLRFLFSCILIGINISVLQAQANTLLVTDKTTSFPIFSASTTATFCADSNDATVVTIAAKAFVNDIFLISGKHMRLLHQLPATGFTIVAGTIGQSPIIDEQIRVHKIAISGIESTWERFLIRVVDNKILIVGSDRRGTAYGIFHLSRLMGVSPWVWWADVLPTKRRQLFASGSYISTSPSVQYRGIFINDEDWGMQPWAANTMDTAIKDIGPKTYAKVFELLLRLKANYIWPAMHTCTKAFYYYKQNPQVADDYAIIVGGSHCEPMLRNNVCEWAETYEEEYKKKPGEWRYDVNKDEIYTYWNDRIKEAVHYEPLITIGMRGVHDGSMPGPNNSTEKVKLLEAVISDQRDILQKNFNQPADKLPQIFIPYKEVLSLYRRGMKLPDDITIIWPDENFGYIRQLSTPKEQERSGGSGIYYHLSYLGGPHDYTWLSSTSPALMAYEMTKAYQFGAQKVWVVNVGDIKPAEMETQFFLDLAWDIDQWTPKNVQHYAAYWAVQNFGKIVGPQIAALKNEYYQLAQAGKPEHMRMLLFSNDERMARLQAYEKLVVATDHLKKQIPTSLRNAFFELIEYPIKGAAYINQKILYAQASFEMPAKAVAYSKKSKYAFEEIKRLTKYYNTGLLKGKWKGIISDMPRNLAVFGMPAVAAPEALQRSDDTATVFDRRYLDRSIDSFGVIVGQPALINISAADYSSKKDVLNDSIVTMNGLGAGGKSISRYPFTGPSFKKEDWETAPFAEYKIQLAQGAYQLFVKCLPTHAIHDGRNLGLAVTINHNAPQFLDINNPQEDLKWKNAILKGFTETLLPIHILNNQEATIRVYFLDTGLALSQLDFNRTNTQ